jgi:hypothetical protein
MANPAWRLAFGSFDKIFFGIEFFLNDYLDQVTFFFTSTIVCPQLHGTSLRPGLHVQLPPHHLH